MKNLIKWSLGAGVQPRALIDYLKNGLSGFLLIGALLTSTGAMIYKINSFDGIAAEVQAQGNRLAVIEERAATLGQLRSEDLQLLRRDIQELKEMIRGLDRKIEQLR